jgi:hypothetical protein
VAVTAFQALPSSWRVAQQQVGILRLQHVLRDFDVDLGVGVVLDFHRILLGFDRELELPSRENPPEASGVNASLYAFLIPHLPDIWGWNVRSYTNGLTGHQGWCENMMKEAAVAIVETRMAPEHTGASKEEMLKLLDLEVEKFSAFMANLPDWRARGPLNNPEKALLKTYLVHKVAGHIE